MRYYDINNGDITVDGTSIYNYSRDSLRKQIGMAVPCRGAQIIFEAILKSFAGIPYDSIPSNIKI